MRTGLDASRERALLWMLIAGYTALYSFVCLTKYHHYLYTDFDLAIFAQAMDGMLRGSFVSSIRGMNWLGDHASLNLFVLLPVFAVFRHPITLLLIQSAALALGAVPVERLARREGLGPGASLACAALYLLYPAVGYTNLYEFHPETLATAPLLFAFDSLRAGRLRPLVLWTALALLAKEDIVLSVGGLALYALLVPSLPRRFRHAALLAGMAAASLVVSLTVLKGFNAGEAEYGKFYQAWGSTTGEALSNMLTHPGQVLAHLVGTPGDPSDTRLKHELYLQLLLPVGFVSLASPTTLVPALPVLALHMLSARPGDHALVFQYTVAITPFVLAAAVLGWARLSRWLAPRPAPKERSGGKKPRSASGATSRPSGGAKIGVAVMASAGLSQLLFGPLIGLGWFQSMRATESNFPTPMDRALTPVRDRLLARLPPTGGVVAGFEFLPRLTRRGELHSLHHVLTGLYTNSTKHYPIPTGVTALIANGGLAGTVYADLGSAARLQELCRANGLRPTAAVGDLMLLTRAPDDTVETVTTVEPLTEPPVTIRFDGQVAFEGADSPSLRAAPGGSVTVPTTWRRLGQVDRLYLMGLLLIDARGREVSLPIRNLGTPFAPVHEWPADRDVRDVVRVVLPLGLAPGRYTLAFRLLWRTEDDRSGAAEPDDASIRSRSGRVDLGTIEVVRGRS